MPIPDSEELLCYENNLFEKGYNVIAGIDEAGRGPLAGPVVSACVLLTPNDQIIEGIYDSKRISEKKRESLFQKIIGNHAYGFGIIDHKTIDKINIYNASKIAMIEALKNATHENSADYVLIDAVKLELDIPCLPIVKGDQKSYVIAAASILAKVYRDRIMNELHNEYPLYGWDKNKGYPTVAHREAIIKHGPSPYHRLSFSFKRP